jgi:hypothetical protein
MAKTTVVFEVEIGHSDAVSRDDAIRFVKDEIERVGRVRVGVHHTTVTRVAKNARLGEVRGRREPSIMETIFGASAPAPWETPVVEPDPTDSLIEAVGECIKEWTQNKLRSRRS